MTSLQNPIICALDTKDLAQAKALATSLKPHVGAIKLGLEFFTIHGAQGVKAVADLGVPIFLDLKFHDIPNTVAEAVRAATRLGVFMMTIHTLGGVKMMQHAARAAKEEAQALGITKPLIVGVTVLTSMDHTDLEDIGIHASPNEQVETLAKLAKNAGLDGVVCSSHEIKSVKILCGADFLAVTPGIRPASNQHDDQKRVMTPAQALAEGSDFLVIGRPITQSPDPATAAHAIKSTI